MALPPPRPEVHSDSNCGICHELLLLPSSHEPLEPSHVIDDVQLPCSHHFHKGCILGWAISSSNIHYECPLCRTTVLNNSGVFLVTVRTETGLIVTIDIGPEIQDAQRTQDFLTLMALQKFDEAERMLRGEDARGNGERLSPNVTYEVGRMTALHTAALNDYVEGVELLLRYGADPLLKDKSGQTALQMASKNGAQKVIPILTSATDWHIIPLLTNASDRHMSSSTDR